MMGFSAWKILIVVLLVVLLFGSHRLRSLGSDLGSALGGFRRSMGEEDSVAGEDRARRELK